MDLSNFKNLKVLCIGDVMLDTFEYGSVNRISPEAPIPILKSSHKKTMLGGAGNVVTNIVELGAQVTFISAIGEDAPGREILGLLEKYSNVEAYIYVDNSRPTTTKTRYVSGKQQMLRIDTEDQLPINQKLEKQIIKTIKECIDKVDVIVVSDYNKGLVTTTIKQLIAEAKTPALKIANSKSDIFFFEGIDLLTLNKDELAEHSQDHVRDETEIKYAAEHIVEELNIDKVLVTMGSEGMLLFQKNISEPLFFPAENHLPLDVSGAGDTVVAIMGIALANRFSVEQSLQLSSVGAGLVVGKMGTSFVSLPELQFAIDTQTLHVTKNTDYLTELVEYIKNDGKKVGFVNGCFDLLHLGHLHFLREAKKKCDYLVVGINSDLSIKKLKGNDRPIQDEVTRATILSTLKLVDYVIIFEQDDPSALVTKTQPSVVFKGSDYRDKEYPEKSILLSLGIPVVYVDRYPEVSTTTMIEKIKT